MNPQDESSKLQKSDMTFPIILTGLCLSYICICICMCATLLLILIRQYSNNKASPMTELVEPTSIPVSCPAIPAGWELVMKDSFDANKYDWSVGKETDAYADSELQIVDGLLRYDIKAYQGVFFHYHPTTETLTDFYLTSQVRKVDGPIDAEYGITYREVGDQILFFAIQDSGLVKVHGIDSEDNWLPILFKGYSENINVGENNELVVLGQDNHYTFCVNQYIVGEISDLEYRYGKSGIAVELENAKDEATFEFDDFIIYTPAK